ncbi:MAG: Grx4 family monothiol glutaredoxin [Oligoflexia bacterium]|nr:Grx4 family monothiol glutaredoxin [Oligoflexia bacterium]
MSNDNNPFNILGSEKVPEAGGTAITEESKSDDINERIKALINSSDIFLFMKGVPDFPQCGFSANVVGILNAMNAKYNTFDILTDMDIRQGVKEYANWPTYPQLYVKGKMIGGNDIITELYEAGELEEALQG